MPRSVVVAVAGIVLRAVALAQLPPVPDATVPAAAEVIATPAPVDSPTRRPTRRPTRVPSDTPAVEDTATTTAAPSLTATPAPSLTATHRPPPTPTVAAAPATATSRPATGTLPSTASSPTLPLLVGGGLALVGITIGALISGAGARMARRRARRTLATAMLLELRRIDAVLRRVVELENPASFPSLEHPIMESALRDLTLFPTDTAARIAQFHGALRGIQHEIGDYRDNPLRWAGRLGDLNQLIKSRAAAACRAVPQLLKALERAGGAPPPQLHDTPARSAAVTPSGLPPPPFGPGDADDWTL